MSTTTQLVDPFIPQRKPVQSPKQRKLFGQYGSPWIKRVKPQTHTPVYTDQVRTKQGGINDLPGNPSYLPQLKRGKDSAPATAAQMSLVRSTINNPAVQRPNKYSQTLPLEKTRNRDVDTTRHTTALRKFVNKLQIPGFMLLAVATGLLSQSLVFGGIVIVIYALFAYFLPIASRTTFLISLITLTIVIILYVTDPTVNAAPNFAIYTILLIGIGVMTMGRETTFVKP